MLEVNQHSQATPHESRPVSLPGVLPPVGAISHPPAKERETDTHVRPTPTHSIQKFTNVEDFRIG